MGLLRQDQGSQQSDPTSRWGRGNSPGGLGSGNSAGIFAPTVFAKERLWKALKEISTHMLTCVFRVFYSGLKQAPPLCKTKAPKVLYRKDLGASACSFPRIWKDLKLRMWAMTTTGPDTFKTGFPQLDRTDILGQTLLSHRDLPWVLWVTLDSLTWGSIY